MGGVAIVTYASMAVELDRFGRHDWDGTLLFWLRVETLRVIWFNSYLLSIRKSFRYAQNEMKQLYMFTDVTIDDIYAVKEGSAPLPACPLNVWVCMMLFDIDLQFCHQCVVRSKLVDKVEEPTLQGPQTIPGKCFRTLDDSIYRRHLGFPRLLRASLDAKHCRAVD